ncbi:MAG: glycosyltransferase family 4 protein [Planctomycetota bacterium]
MKVLHLHDAPQILGGPSRYLRRLIPEMAARGVRSALFSLSPAGEALAPEQEAFSYRWPRTALRRRHDFHRFHAPLARALAAFAGRARPDLVHVQNAAAFRSTLFPTLQELGLPVLMTVHDFTLVDPNPWGLTRRGLLGPWKKHLDRRSLVRSRQQVFSAVSLFLCPTEALRIGIPFPENRSRLLRLPVVEASAAPLPGPPLRLLFAGTLYRSKGVDLLLEALARARGPATDARLEVAGEGDQEAELASQARALGLAGRVTFIGHLDPAGMEAAYARTALLVLPSRVPENSPLTVLEAGARGRPSAASHAGGVPELIAPPARGWTFPPEDPAALARVLEEAAGDPAGSAARGARMRAWVRGNFAPQAHWDALMALYREVSS